MTRNFSLKDCRACGDPYVPTSSTCKWCSNCYDTETKKIRAAYEKTEHVRERCRISQRKRYNLFERFHSKIMVNEDFVSFILSKINDRRGDTLNVKASAKQGCKRLGLVLDKPELLAVYTGVAKMFREHGGKAIEQNSRESWIYQWER